jgi:hypothetical protein
MDSAHVGESDLFVVSSLPLSSGGIVQSSPLIESESNGRRTFFWASAVSNATVMFSQTDRLPSAFDAAIGSDAGEAGAFSIGLIAGVSVSVAVLAVAVAMAFLAWKAKQGSEADIEDDPEDHELGEGEALHSLEGALDEDSDLVKDFSQSEGEAFVGVQF